MSDEENVKDRDVRNRIRAGKKSRETTRDEENVKDREL